MMDNIVISSDDEDEATTKVSHQGIELKQESDNPNDILNEDVCRHSKFLRAYCMRCGAQESIKSHCDIQKKYDSMDNYLKFSNKIRISIKGDGHCLPRAVFRGAKNLNLIPQFITYSALFNAVVETIKTEIETYTSFLTESVDSAFMDLDSYLKDKKYSLNSNIIDVVIFALATKTSCQIKVHYRDIDDSFDTHVISPSSTSKGVIELSFINGHYDLISKSTDVVKQEPCSVVEEPLLQDDDFDNIYIREEAPPARRSKKRISSELDVSDSEDDFLIEVNSLLRPHHKISRSSEKSNDGETCVSTAIKVDSVPGDINDTIVYEVPMLKTLQNCKGNRPWGTAISSKSVKFKEGPRLLFHCRGSYVCMNPSCNNIPEFGINRIDFIGTNPVLCKNCTSKAEFIDCDASLILEKNNRAEIVTVKHIGIHTCPSVTVKGRPNAKNITKLVETFPKITREGIIRQMVGNHIEQGNFRGAVDEAKSFTDTKYIENLKAKAKSVTRPYGHSFNAVSRLKEQWDKQDKFLVYKISGTESDIPFVMKSSKRKVEIMLKMDRDGDHPLASEAVHLDVVHSRCKGWKTYTLSYYDVLLQCMIKLCTMDTVAECKEACTIFFENINNMLRECIKETELEADGMANYVFNPYHIKDDEHGGNKIGMRNVLGEDFVETRTSSCLFHFDLSIKRHKKLIRQEDAVSYCTLCHDLKNAPTKQEYEKRKTLLEMLISRQNERSKRSLYSALQFWDKARYRWAFAYRTTTHNVPMSSMAEAAHASMKAAGEKNLSLVDAIFADLVDSARLEAKWQNRINGERCTGTGPSGYNLSIREEIRQMGRADMYAGALYEVNSSSDEDEYSVGEGSIYNSQRSHRPDKRATQLPKITQRKMRSLNSKAFKCALDKSREKSIYTKCTSITKREESAEVSIEQCKRRFKVTLNSEVFCSCGPGKRADRKICSHVLWIYVNLLHIKEDDPLIAQVSLSRENLATILNCCPDSVPSNLNSCSDKETRIFNAKLRNHSNFNNVQEWIVDRKKASVVSRCSGCLVQGAIKQNDLHLYVKGLLYLHDRDKVVETKLRFCKRRSCVTNIRGSLHNIKDIPATMIIKKSSMDLIISEEEQIDLITEGFVVEM